MGKCEGVVFLFEKCFTNISLFLDRLKPKKENRLIRRNGNEEGQQKKLTLELFSKGLQTADRPKPKRQKKRKIGIAG